MNPELTIPDGFSIFDVHVHVGTYGDHACFPPLYLQELCSRVPVERFACAPFSWEEQIQRLRGCDPGIFPPALKAKALNWLWVSPVREAALEILKGKQCPRGYAGIKIHPYVDQYDVMLSLIRPVVKAAERWAVPVAVHTGNRGCMPKDVCRCFPKGFSQALILFHSRPLDESIDAANKSSCVYLELSFCDAEDFARAFDAVGPNRLLFGSDFPAAALYYPGLDVISYYCLSVEALLTAAKRQEAVKAVFRENARAVFHIATDSDGQVA